MAVENYEFAGLSTRQGFNRSLRHFKIVTEILGGFEEHRNLADILNALHDEKRLEAHQVNPILNAVFVGHPKYKYINHSYNLKNNIEDFGPIVAEVGKWTSMDMVIAYFHPDLGLTLINPKNAQHWDAVRTVRRNELLTIYSGAFADKGADKLYRDAIEKLIDLLEGNKVRVPASFTKGEFKQKPPKPVPGQRRAGERIRKQKGPAEPAAQPQAVAAIQQAVAPPPQKRRMTPMYSIIVTNELFHNGNVEAWKRVIQSYNARHPNLEVFIFYEGERIHDINTLFKWGKVKHGSAIMITIAGEDIQDVAKLQRYLKQGASPMFEAFLRFPVNTVLNLF